MTRIWFAFTFLLWVVVDSFQMSLPSRSKYAVRATSLRESNTDKEPENEEEMTNIQKFLTAKYPDFFNLLSKNNDGIKAVNAESSCTVFCPNARAFEKLGSKKREQLEDPRNLEIVQKIGAYHIIPNEAVSYQQLRTEDWTGPKPADGSPRPFAVGGIVTLGGEVPVGRPKKWTGVFSFFSNDSEAKDDDYSGLVIGPNAKIVKSFEVGESFVHEMDDLISPELLWRYCDQLRIPGF